MPERKKSRPARGKKGRPARKARPTPAGRFAYEGLDRVLHEKARLGILISLMTHPEGLLFNDLKELCSLTDGNLSRHIQVLNEAGLVDVWKGYEKRRPQTLCRLTHEGTKRFQDYVRTLESVIQDALPRGRRNHVPAGDIPPDWVPV